MSDLYRDAQAFAEEQVNQSGNQEQRSYWAAWYAGRRASDALLDRAKTMGLTVEQQEELRAVAAEVAYD